MTPRVPDLRSVPNPPDDDSVEVEEVHILADDYDETGGPGDIPDWKPPRPDGAGTRKEEFEENASDRIDKLLDGLALWPKTGAGWQILAAVAAATAVTFGIALAIAAALFTVLEALAKLLLGFLGGARDFIAHWRLTHVITDGVRGFFTEQAGGLGVSVKFLMATWGGLLLTLLVLGFLGSRGARWGWLVAGTATVVMVWLGSPAGSRELAAILTVGAWSILSILALGSAGGPVVFNRWRVIERTREIQHTTSIVEVEADPPDKKDKG